MRTLIIKFATSTFRPTDGLSVVQGGEPSEEQSPQSPSVDLLGLSRKRRRIGQTVAHRDHAPLANTTITSATDSHSLSEENARLRQRIADQDRQIKRLKAKVRYLTEIAEISNDLE